MQNEILYAIIQAATEFLPISSSGHLALMSNILDTPNLFLITTLHLASLLAVIIFTRKEIYNIITLKEKKLALYLIIATIPAVIFGLFFKDLIEQTFSSLLVIGIAFIFTGTILFLTRFANRLQPLNAKNALIIGLFQIVALFPGISRSGMTISSALFAGIPKDKATKFSFLLFIPLAIGAGILEIGDAYFSTTLAIAFVICFILSLIFLQALTHIIKRNKFWLFSIYCWLIGIITLYLYFR
ncbi:UDP-diphosphatase [Candidatus Pacearchaeota archaeon]|nr:UDP-diphosphatase [Candidatus Pacearchaeota archaeon]|tara:strand:+ start:2147 stop:2872 length:726 start_codon:yes stop_codon:yes gene_type:complete